jgi:hypothetical protein
LPNKSILIWDLCHKPFCHPEQSEGPRFFLYLGDSSVASLPQNDQQGQFDGLSKQKKLLAIAIIRRKVIYQA